jgi:predicted dehydrogenase
LVNIALLQTVIPVGKPIFCEKPFTTSADEAFAPFELIRTHGTIVHRVRGTRRRPAMRRRRGGHHGSLLSVEPFRWLGRRAQRGIADFSVLDG